MVQKRFSLRMVKSSRYCIFANSFSPCQNLCRLSSTGLISIPLAHLPNVHKVPESLLGIPRRLILASSGFLYAMWFARARNCSKRRSSTHSFLSESTATMSVKLSAVSSPRLNLGTSQSSVLSLHKPRNALLLSSCSTTSPQDKANFSARPAILLSSSCK